MLFTCLMLTNLTSFWLTNDIDALFDTLNAEIMRSVCMVVLTVLGISSNFLWKALHGDDILKNPWTSREKCKCPWNSPILRCMWNCRLSVLILLTCCVLPFCCFWVWLIANKAFLDMGLLWLLSLLCYSGYCILITSWNLE